MKHNIKEVAAMEAVSILPEDRYTVVIEDAVATRSSTQKEMITLTFKVIEGKHKNRKMWANLVLDGKAFRFVIDVLKAYDSKLLESVDASTEELAADMKGKIISVFAEPDLSGLKPKNKVKLFQKAPANIVNGTAPKKSLF